MTVPYTFANASGQVPAAELDANFAAVGEYAKDLADGYLKMYTQASWITLNTTNN